VHVGTGNIRDSSISLEAGNELDPHLASPVIQLQSTVCILRQAVIIEASLLKKSGTIHRTWRL
jgi:hypothetical protein